MKDKFIARDISWLSFNGRVLQEANDPTVSLSDRVRFLGIFSNNLDEFFRVRVATLKRMSEFVNKKGNINGIDLIESPQVILDQIQTIVLKQQNEFNRIWQNINKELKANKVLLVDDKKLTIEQKQFVKQYFDDEVRPYIIPLMIENVQQNRIVVRLHSGDLTLYSAIYEQIQALSQANIAYECVPGISAFQAAAAKLSCRRDSKRTLHDGRRGSPRATRPNVAMVWNSGRCC
jgi:polyphosphate kinase